MNALLTLAARTLVEFFDVHPTADAAGACDAVLRFLVEKGCPQGALRRFPRAVEREMRRVGHAVPAQLLTPTGHAGESASHIASTLTKALHAKVELTEKADLHLLGGASLTVGDERLDMSLRGALHHLQSHLVI